MTFTREQLQERKRQFEEFNRWEAEQDEPVREPERILADVGTLLSWLPPDVRREDPDPEKRGVQKLRAMLAYLDSRR
ncbi:MAG: hypothetical protein HYR60_00010 [Acidobacteria bacterium]|nr:hypothetical protein [Acidobacteriota bacterium]MBI3473080.1 hypothetical protein [Candidatus Solibacter usitatus]